MEKTFNQELEHVYSEDIKQAIYEARKLMPNNKRGFKGDEIQEGGTKYLAFDYRVERKKTTIVTTIKYKEV